MNNVIGIIYMILKLIYIKMKVNREYICPGSECDDQLSIFTFWFVSRLAILTWQHSFNLPSSTDWKVILPLFRYAVAIETNHDYKREVI